SVAGIGSSSLLYAPDSLSERLYETHWLPRFFAHRVGLTQEGAVTPSLVSRLLEHPRFSQLRIERKELEGLLAAYSTSTAGPRASRWWGTRRPSTGWKSICCTVSGRRRNSSI